MSKNDSFSFEISLSILNHLGRNLYRSFITVLGEAISNSWDAEANNVWIYIDRENSSLVVKDDGNGMDSNDFQTKFLKIGYSKRSEFGDKSENGRPFIGRKGIGKLAMLSCAEKVTIISKKKGENYIGGVIDNSGLDEAINDDLTPDQYPLEDYDEEIIREYGQDHDKGTILYFENIQEGVRNTLEYLRRMIALNFRFSLIDSEFNIYVEDEIISPEDLNVLAEKTEFVWLLNEIDDPFIEEKLTIPPLKEDPLIIEDEGLKIHGFIASVVKPRDLKVITTEERVSIDLFVNGRLREKDIIKHIPTARITESYLYGQIHFNELDDENDRFTSSREGIVADDPKFETLLIFLKEKILSKIIKEWDELRRKHREDGDIENTSISTKERKSRELYNVVSSDYDLPEESINKRKIDIWLNELADDAHFSFSSFAECYISENLLRKYIVDKEIDFSAKTTIIDQHKNKENQDKRDARLSIELRRDNIDLSYLSMSNLAEEIERSNVQDILIRDSKIYRPIRNALMHTSLLSDVAKRRLTTVYDNIKQRITILLDGGEDLT